jgi:hypothetical protein
MQIIEGCIAASGYSAYKGSINWDQVRLDYERQGTSRCKDWRSFQSKVSHMRRNLKDILDSVGIYAPGSPVSSFNSEDNLTTNHYQNANALAAAAAPTQSYAQAQSAAQDQSAIQAQSAAQAQSSIRIQPVAQDLAPSSFTATPAAPASQPSPPFFASSINPAIRRPLPSFVPPTTFTPTSTSQSVSGSGVSVSNLAAPAPTASNGFRRAVLDGLAKIEDDEAHLNILNALKNTNTSVKELQDYIGYQFEDLTFEETKNALVSIILAAFRP